MRKIKILLGLYYILLLTGCTGMINDSLRAVDTAWEIENQQQPEKLSNRIVNASYEDVFDAVKKTYNDLGMPIEKYSFEKGFIVSRNPVPKPLSKTQWESVREIENPKLKKITSLITLSEKPEGNFLITNFTLKKLGSQTDVNLSYYLDMQVLADMGYIPIKEAPPHAVKLVSEILWNKLDENLADGRED